MSVRISGDQSGGFGDTASVRLDLGEIEISVRELLELRPGSVLNLGAKPPLPCALLVGTTSLAQGVIECIGETLRVRITKSVEQLHAEELSGAMP